MSECVPQPLCMRKVSLIPHVSTITKENGKRGLGRTCPPSLASLASVAVCCVANDPRLSPTQVHKDMLIIGIRMFALHNLRSSAFETLTFDESTILDVIYLFIDRFTTNVIEILHLLQNNINDIVRHCAMRAIRSQYPELTIPHSDSVALLSTLSLMEQGYTYLEDYSDTKCEDLIAFLDIIAFQHIVTQKYADNAGSCIDRMTEAFANVKVALQITLLSESIDNEHLRMQQDIEPSFDICDLLSDFHAFLNHVVPYMRRLCKLTDTQIDLFAEQDMNAPVVVPAFVNATNDVAHNA